MNDNLTSPRRQDEQGEAAATGLDAPCPCTACQRNRCEPSVSSLGLAQAPVQKETQPPSAIPEYLFAMKRDMDPLVWQEVLKQRALKLVEEEMRERAAARVARSEAVQTVQVQPAKPDPLTKSAGLDLDVDGMLMALQKQPSEPAPAKSAEAPSQRSTSTRQDFGYRLVHETPAHRFYREKPMEQVEAEDPATPRSAVGSELNYQHLQLDQLGEALERMEDRLRTVLDGAAEGWKAAEPQPAGPPLLEDLRSVSARLESLHERMVRLQVRLIL